MSTILQIINIDKNYQENVIDLTLYDTDFVTKIQKLLSDSGATLENVIGYGQKTSETQHYKVSVELLEDIYTRQLYAKDKINFFINNCWYYFFPAGSSKIYPSLTWKTIFVDTDTDIDVILLEKVINNEVYLEELRNTINLMAQTYLKDFDFCIPETNIIYNDPKYYIPEDYLEWTPPTYQTHLDCETDDIIDIDRFAMYNIELGYRTDFYQDKNYGKENFMSESAFYPFLLTKIDKTITTFIEDDRNQHTLDNFRNTDSMTQQLLEDIKYRQDKIHTSLVNYYTAIKDYADDKGIIIFLTNDATAETIFSDNYDTLLNTEIQSGEVLTNTLANKINQNALIFKYIIYRIREVLTRIRSVLTETTGYFAVGNDSFPPYTERIFSLYKAPGYVQASTDNTVVGTDTFFTEQFKTFTYDVNTKSEGLYIATVDNYSTYHFLYFTTISSNISGYIEYMWHSSSATFPFQEYWKFNLASFTRLTTEQKNILNAIPEKELTLKDFTDITG